MKKITLLLSLILLISSCYTSKPNQSKQATTQSTKEKQTDIEPPTTGPFHDRYISFLDKGETILASHYTSVKTSTSDGQFIKRTFYPDTKQITSITHYLDKDFSFKHGAAKTWQENGDISSAGEYFNNKNNGPWKYYIDGVLSSEGKYANGQKIDIWKSLNGKKITGMTLYKDGLKDGKFVQFDSVGVIINQGVYRADTIFSQSNPSANSDYIEQHPSIISCPEALKGASQMNTCSMKKITKFIYSNIEYPMIATDYKVEGRALVQFYVEKDGTIGKAKIIKGLCNPIKKELNRVLNKMRKELHFRPGIKNGKPTRVNFFLPVKFQLS